MLPPRTGVWIRPQCRARKSDVLAHLARHQLTFAEDPSNRNTRFLRTRVRFELLPLLEQLSPQIVGHLCALADSLRVESSGFDVDAKPDARGKRPASSTPDVGSTPRAGNIAGTSPQAVDLIDERGVALLLNRAQRQLVGRARTLGQRTARVRLRHGREITLDPVTLEPRLGVAAPRKR